LAKRRPIEFLIDASVDKLSANRLCLFIVIGLVIYWVRACVNGYPPQYAVAPVSYMLGAVTTAICGIYAVSTYSSGNPFGGIIQKFGGAVWSKTDPITPAIGKDPLV
jgi:hypothetical protein